MVSSVKVLAIPDVKLRSDAVIYLMKCFPSLEKLYIKTGHVGNKNMWHRKYRNLISTLDICLKKIVFADYLGNKSHINFAKLFISNARVLELVMLELEEDGNFSSAWVLKDNIGCSRSKGGWLQGRKCLCEERESDCSGLKKWTGPRTCAGAHEPATATIWAGPPSCCSHSPITTGRRAAVPLPPLEWSPEPRRGDGKKMTKLECLDCIGKVPYLVTMAALESKQCPLAKASECILLENLTYVPGGNPRLVPVSRLVQARRY
ncbi:hypothetical protein C2845_PM03G18490 [Panicum miliaceum]|uniref:Uncharacterized protein n=1 Tax=Panicum miliaceum TaxID=4540 RepID=A0A3L6TFN3_PANMI|nr:hypothetical protein C2845_PM03G18490 [Panicum miliaceum]